MKPLRVPINVASRKGVSWLVDSSARQPIVLTKLGNPVAMVTSCDDLEDASRAMSDAALSVLSAAATVAADRARFGFSLDDACARLGLDADEVRRAADARRYG